jgi:transglutaminase-like putative cysteine protease
VNREAYLIDERTAEAQVFQAELPHWAWRYTQWLVERWRPYLDWPVLVVCMLLASLPTMALGENRLAELRRIQVGLDTIGTLAVLTTWLWLGWRRPHRAQGFPVLRAIGLFFLMLVTAVLVLSQLLMGWLPGLGELWWALRTGAWGGLGQELLGDWVVMGTRFVIWWQGVRAGGAAQDNLIFATLAGSLFWLIGVVTAWLARRHRQGFLAAVPVLWVLGLLLLYSTAGRGLMVVGMLLAVTLHLLLDQQNLMRRWRVQHLDYSPGLFWDRLVAASAIVALVVALAAVVPNWYFDKLIWAYYGLIEPFDQRLEGFRDQLFPDLKGASRLRAGGALDGLPNEFLLGAGVELGERIVMLVRTNDSAGYTDYPGSPLEAPPPPGHYMRGVTLTRYDGHGWSNPSDSQRQDYVANERWDSREPKGRKPLVQSVTLFFNASVLYGAPEQMEPGLAYDAEWRAEGDLVALWSRARNYSIVSSIPAVSEEQLASVPAWGENNPLPNDYAPHLQLPDTITDRTRQLAARLTAGLSSPHAQAQAIESYLRQYEYDLAVPEPPASVVDVADYFLFDLRKGYCDYYSTAFIVLARLAGLPARFATGYAVGTWDSIEQVWIVTEAEAHSWPEVYLPEYGWIPYEPTAGRPILARIGLPEFSNAPAIPVAPLAESPEASGRNWNWQIFVWLAPLAFLVWGGLVGWERWRIRREDPWQGLLRWGRRIGRPIAESETVLEYGRDLAGYILDRQIREQDTGRVAAREVTGLSHAVNTLRYGPAILRSSAITQAIEHWQRLQGYLGRLTK